MNCKNNIWNSNGISLQVKGVLKIPSIVHHISLRLQSPLSPAQSLWVQSVWGSLALGFRGNTWLSLLYFCKSFEGPSLIMELFFTEWYFIPHFSKASDLKYYVNVITNSESWYNNPSVSLTTWRWGSARCCINGYVACKHNGALCVFPRDGWIRPDEELTPQTLLMSLAAHSIYNSISQDAETLFIYTLPQS